MRIRAFLLALIIIASRNLFARPGKTAWKEFPSFRIVEKEETITPPRIVQPKPIEHFIFQKTTYWRTICSLNTYTYLPPNEFLGVRVDIFSSSLTLTGYTPPLTENALLAIEKSPQWLRDDLVIAFARMTNSFQDMYANLILSVDNPIIDEVAFQVAHMSYQSLTAPYANPTLLLINAEKIYEIAPLLQYVELIDHGRYPDDPNYYTTVRYRVIDHGDTIWTEEYPKEIYYWFIVHPKLSDEKVKMTDSDGDSRQRTYGYFWREYLLFNPSSTRPYTTDSSLVLANVLRIPKYLWTRADSSFPPGRPFTPNDGALDVVGNWVSKILPYGAAAPRPIQPNQIAYSHHGYCGEVQDLLCAASRCALIPGISTMDPAEDHVWNEFYDRQWEYYQVDREGGGTSIGYDGGRQDVDFGGGKNVSMIWNYWGDGYMEDVTNEYSRVCTLVVNVRDELGFPVDGALILVATEGFYDTTTLDITGCSFTNRNGQAKFVAGDRRNFYIRAESSIGSYPGTGTVTPIARSTVPGMTYTSNIVIRGHVPFLPLLSELDPPDSSGASHILRVSYRVPSEYIVQNNSYYDSEGSEFRHPSPTGGIAFFICDSTNYAQFTSGNPFSAYFYEDLTPNGELEMYLPHPGPWFVVASNQNALRNIQRVELSVALVQAGTFVDLRLPHSQAPSIIAYPNPFNSEVTFEIVSNSAGEGLIEIFNISGELIYRKGFSIVYPCNSARIIWDGRNSLNEPVPSGVYFFRANLNGKLAGVKSLLLVK